MTEKSQRADNFYTVVGKTCPCRTLDLTCVFERGCLNSYGERAGCAAYQILLETNGMTFIWLKTTN